MIDNNTRSEDGVIHLAYFGNFYATRGLDDVLAALATWTFGHGNGFSCMSLHRSQLS